jgi:hypothetical protein
MLTPLVVFAVVYGRQSEKIKTMYERLQKLCEDLEKIRDAFKTECANAIDRHNSGIEKIKIDYKKRLTDVCLKINNCVKSDNLELQVKLINNNTEKLYNDILAKSAANEKIINSMQPVLIAVQSHLMDMKKTVDVTRKVEREK